MPIKNVIGLGIETSCDDTSVSIVKNGRDVLSLKTFSQVKLHSTFQGVVPEIASRNHLLKINGLIEDALGQSNTSWKDLSYLAVTNKPGLIGSLIVGLQTAKAISLARDIDLIGINHLAAHIHAPFLRYDRWQGPPFPTKKFLALLISGGSTALIGYESPDSLHLFGSTRDDAAGESFDKIAKLLNLGYPGGPIIESLAARSSFLKGRSLKEVPLPPILRDSPKSDLSFSFSGIKTAVYYLMKSIGDISKNKKKNGMLFDKTDIAFSLQFRITELLQRNISRLLEKYRSYIKSDIISDNFVLGGGVAANKYIRENLQKTVEKFGMSLMAPPGILCTDNGAMVASCGYYLWEKGNKSEINLEAYSRPEWASLPGKNQNFLMKA